MFRNLYLFPYAICTFYPIQFALFPTIFPLWRGLFLIITAAISRLKSVIGANMNTETAEILSRKKAAALLGICLVTLDRLDIPRTKIRHRVMYRRDVLNKWIEDHTESNKKGKRE